MLPFRRHPSLSSAATSLPVNLLTVSLQGCYTDGVEKLNIYPDVTSTQTDNKRNLIDKLTSRQPRMAKPQPLPELA